MNRRQEPFAVFNSSGFPDLTPAFLASSALFCSSRQNPPFVFKRFRTLAKTIGGGGWVGIFYSQPPQLKIPRFAQRRSSDQTSFPFPPAPPIVTSRSSLASNSFRIRTYKSVSKQRTLSPSRMNTYKKIGGRGDISSVNGSGTPFPSRPSVANHQLTPLLAASLITAFTCSVPPEC
jgi:hypothetical protein